MVPLPSTLFRSQRYVVTVFPPNDVLSEFPVLIRPLKPTIDFSGGSGAGAAGAGAGAAGVAGAGGASCAKRERFAKRRNINVSFPFIMRPKGSSRFRGKVKSSGALFLFFLCLRE